MQSLLQQGFNGLVVLPPIFYHNWSKECIFPVIPRYWLYRASLYVKSQEYKVSWISITTDWTQTRALVKEFDTEQHSYLYSSSTIASGSACSMASEKYSSSVGRNTLQSVTNTVH